MRGRGPRWPLDRYREHVRGRERIQIVGVKDCHVRGFQQIGFKEYDTGRQGSWMVQLTDTPATQESQN